MGRDGGLCLFVSFYYKMSPTVYVTWVVPGTAMYMCGGGGELRGIHVWGWGRAKGNKVLEGGGAISLQDSISVGTLTLEFNRETRTFCIFDIMTSGL